MAAAVVALGVAVLLLANGGLARMTAAVGTAFNGFVGDLTRTPAPSVAELDISDPPTLEAPDEPYTNQARVDLSGTVPAAIAGTSGTRIRIYVALGKGVPGIVIEQAVGARQQFLIPGLSLSPGANIFTATIVGPNDTESDISAAVTYVLDTAKPKITITAPKADALVNAKSVRVTGKTQARSTLNIRNLTTNATVTGEADTKGAFTISIPIGPGSNKIQVTATDPAGNGNVASVTVQRGTGALTASVVASFYHVRLSKLPESVDLTVTVTDPDGKALAGANVTFTLAVPGVPAITSSVLTTGTNGRVSFTTTIPKGATEGQCSVTAIVQTTDLGDTTDRTVITIRK